MIEREADGSSVEMSRTTAFPPALEGVKILDLSQVGAGPYCTTLLGDMGADVIKVEPIGGEPTRTIDNFFGPKESAYYYGINRSKRTVALDIKADAGIKIISNLIKWADVFVIGMRPNTVARLGLAYEDVAAINPMIIYLSITAFGESGPRIDEPGMDIVAQALSGVMALTGDPDRPPVKCGPSITDWAASFLGSFAVSAALRARDRDGVGQKLSVSLLDGAVALLPQFVSSYKATGVAPRRSGSGHPMVVPYQVFSTADGNIIVACLDNRFWPRLCRSIDRPDLIDDPRYSENEERVRRRDEVIGIVQNALLCHPTSTWIERFTKESMAHAPVLELEEALAEPQILHNEMILTLDHPKYGSYQVANNPIRMSKTPPRPWGYSPGVGQHTDEVLLSLGMQVEELAELRRREIIE